MESPLETVSGGNGGLFGLFVLLAKAFQPRKHTANVSATGCEGQTSFGPTYWGGERDEVTTAVATRGGRAEHANFSGRSLSNSPQALV